ncbi:hypothetical protein BH11MYX4_BH11MYX4_28570 [soil metagenome]
MVDEVELGHYLARLRGIPFVRRVRVARSGAQRQGELTLTLDTPTERGLRFIVELKRTHLTREVADRLLHLRKKGGGELLLLAPVIGRDLAELFAREHVNFVDLAGNCRLDIGGRYMAYVEGRRPESKATADRAFRAPTYRVLFALLARPDLSVATARMLAEASGKVSPQTAIDARLRLVERGILVGSRRAPKWAPGGWKAALDLFVGGFGATLRPSLALGRFRAKERSVEHLEMALTLHLKTEAAGRWGWGGGAASQRLTGHFRGDTTIVYVERAPPNVAKLLGLLPDPAGSVSVLRTPGPAAFQSPRPDTIHPLLAYADLLVDEDQRSREAAAEIHERYLRAIEAAAA